MKFRVLSGVHMQGGREYQRGEIVESPHDLCQDFKLKFERVGDFTENIAAPRKELKGTLTVKPGEGGNPAVDELLKPGPGEPGYVEENPANNEDPNPGKPKGKDVTTDFKIALEQDYKVFKVKKEFFVYDADDLSKSINEDGVDEKGVEKAIKKALG